MSNILKSQVEIGEYIRIMREQIGISSSKELAEQLSVSPATISNWENGVKSPSYINYAILAGLFGVSLDDLFATNDMYKNYKNLSFEEFKDNQEKFVKLSVKRQKEIIIEYINSKKKVLEIYEEICNEKYDNVELLKTLVMKFNFHPQIISTSLEYEQVVIEKIDEDFDWELIDEKDLDDKEINKKLFGFPGVSAKKGNYDVVNTLGYKYSNHNCKKIIDDSIDYFSGNGSFYAIDKNGNKAFVGILNFINYYEVDSFVKKIKYLYESIGFNKVVISELIVAFDRNRNFINEFVDQILFNEDFLDLLPSYLDSLSSFEKYLLLKEYVNQCKIRVINPKVKIIYEFINSDAKIIDSINLHMINYNYEKTYGLLKIIISKISQNKEYISCDELLNVLG